MGLAQYIIVHCRNLYVYNNYSIMIPLQNIYYFINALCNINDFLNTNHDNACFIGYYNLLSVIICLEGIVRILSVLSDFIDFALLHSLTQVVVFPKRIHVEM